MIDRFCGAFTLIWQGAEGETLLLYGFDVALFNELYYFNAYACTFGFLGHSAPITFPRFVGAGFPHTITYNCTYKGTPQLADLSTGMLHHVVEEMYDGKVNFGGAREGVRSSDAISVRSGYGQVSLIAIGGDARQIKDVYFSPVSAAPSDVPCPR